MKTGVARDLPATGIFIFVGFTPNTGVIEGHVEHDAAGYLLTDANMQTSIPGLFAAGDVRVQLTRQVTTAVGDATTAAIAVEKYLTARKNGEAAPAPDADAHAEGGMIVSSVTVGPFAENCHLLMEEDSRLAVLVDPGDEGARIVRAVKKAGAEPRGDLADARAPRPYRRHRRGAARVEGAGLPPSARPAALRPRRAASRGVRHPLRVPASARPRNSPRATCSRSARLRFDVMHVPGHAPGHVAFHGHGMLFSGDVLFAGSIGRSDLPFSNPADLERSLERLAALPPETQLFAGHGPATTIGEELRSNPFLTGVARIARR